MFTANQYHVYSSWQTEGNPADFWRDISECTWESSGRFSVVHGWPFSCFSLCGATSQDKEFGVWGALDWRPDGSLPATWGTRHHVYHIEGMLLPDSTWKAYLEHHLWLVWDYLLSGTSAIPLFFPDVTLKIVNTLMFQFYCYRWKHSATPELSILILKNWSQRLSVKWWWRSELDLLSTCQEEIISYSNRSFTHFKLKNTTKRHGIYVEYL